MLTFCQSYSALTHTYNHTHTHTSAHTHSRTCKACTTRCHLLRECGMRKPPRLDSQLPTNLPTWSTCSVVLSCSSSPSLYPSLFLSLSYLFLSLDPFAVECDLCIAAELPDEVLCVLEIDNIIRNAHKLRTHTAERNGTKRERSGTKWNGTKTTDIGLPLDSCSLKRLIAMIQLHVLRALTLPFSPTVSIFPSPSRCLFCSCHLR